MQNKNLVQFLFLMSFLICKISLRDQVICEKGCQDGFHINEDCSCSEGVFCTMETCPNEGEIKDFRNCACTPKDEILPYKPIICKSTKCDPGFKITSDCTCQPYSSGEFPVKPPIKPIPEINKCLITSCNKHFKLNKSSCKCEKIRGRICRKRCPKGMRVYPLPNRANCKCIKIIKCPIESCASSSNLINCKCQQNFLTPFPILPPIPDPELQPLPCLLYTSPSPRDS